MDNIRDRDQVENELLELYTEKFLALGFPGSPEEIREMVKDGIKTCNALTEAEETGDLPDQFGDKLIEGSIIGLELGVKWVGRAKRAGAREEDIREYWNLPELSRRMVNWSEQIFRYSLFSSCIEEGLSADEAMDKVRKTYPMYGNPENEQHVSGDDRPLPQELRGRVDIYRELHGAKKIQELSKGFTTYNAFIRAELKKGNV